jgi:hypothetical protein
MTTAARINTGRFGAGRRVGRMTGLLAVVSLTVTGLTAGSAQAADTGSITGTVSTKFTGEAAKPATGGYIYLYRLDAATGFYSLVDLDPATDSKGVSFSGSTYTVGGLGAGTYKFEMADANDATGRDYQREYYDDAEYLTAATAIQVGTGVTTVKPMTLEPAGHVAGVVKDAAGKPLADAVVFFEETDGGGSSGVRTDAAGRYTTTAGDDHGLVAGTYRVVSYGPSPTEADPDARSYVSEYWKGAKTYASATPVTVTPGATTANIDFSLDVAPRIRLTVKDPDGNPVKNAAVGVYVFYDGAWGPYRAGPNETDAKGVYRKTVGVNERYKFYINPPSGVGGVLEWYDNAYSEATATEVSATGYGQVRDITIQLGAAPAGTPAPAPAPAPAPTAPAAPKKFTTSKVTIKGTAKVGRTLRASTRAWGPAPVTMSYTWYRNGKVVKGQSKSTYKLRAADQGKRITVRVHQRKASYVTTNRLSAKTAKVTKR